MRYVREKQNRTHVSVPESCPRVIKKVIKSRRWEERNIYKTTVVSKSL